MAQIVGGFCASHAPGQTMRRPAGAEAGARFLSALASVVGELKSAAPDVLVVCSGEHFTNFAPNVTPQLAVGVGQQHTGPSEPWMGIPRNAIPGEPDLAMHLARQLLTSGFDPTTCHSLSLDHGIMTAYLAFDPTMKIPLIPLLQNTLVEPMMPLARCHQMGVAFRRAVESFPGSGRVGVIGTGGLSHWIGTRRDGDIDEDFDNWFLDRLASGDLSEIIALSDSEIDHAGTGAHEIRSWLFAAGALEAFTGRKAYYEAIPAWITGMGLFSYAGTKS